MCQNSAFTVSLLEPWDPKGTDAGDSIGKTLETALLLLASSYLLVARQHLFSLR